MGRTGAQTGRMRSWAVVALVTLLVTGLLTLVGAPSPGLFGSLVGGLVVAVTTTSPPRLPGWLSTIGQGLIGVSIGAVVDPATLEDLAADPVPVAAGVLVTIVVSVVLGQLLRLRGVTPATATFASIAGGASGITAVADELGADSRVVAVVQYLRVLLILVGMPLVAAFVFDAPLGGPGTRPTGGVATYFADLTAPALVFTVASLALGLLLARLVRFPSGTLLMPLAVAAVLAVTGLLRPLGPDAAHLPSLLESVAFLLVGLQVGLKFTRESLRAIVRLVPLAVAIIVAVVVVSAGVGVALAGVMGHTALDGYLATTPGGLYAVLVTARLAGGDVTFVLAVQVLRLVLVLAAAPVLAAYYRRREQLRTPQA